MEILDECPGVISFRLATRQEWGFEDLGALELAVRVLPATIEHCTPDSTDIEKLRRFAPLLTDRAIDELACDVVYAELKRREEVRQVKLGRRLHDRNSL